jgi:ATP-dependent DNA ligase
VFAHACKMGLEGIVSKRRESRYHSGRSRHWVKSKNPLSPAVNRRSRLSSHRLRASSSKNRSTVPYKG